MLCISKTFTYLHMELYGGLGYAVRCIVYGLKAG